MYRGQKGSCPASKLACMDAPRYTNSRREINSLKSKWKKAVACIELRTRPSLLRFESDKNLRLLGTIIFVLKLSTKDFLRNCKKKIYWDGKADEPIPQSLVVYSSIYVHCKCKYTYAQDWNKKKLHSNCHGFYDDFELVLSLKRRLGNWSTLVLTNWSRNILF